MQPIVPADVQPHLAALAGRDVYLHLETTSGAYTEGAYGAFIRNAAIHFSRGLLTGCGPFRAGLQMEHGWTYAEGLTHWELDAGGRLLLAGHDKDGRLTVALQLSLTPFPME